MRFSEVKLPSNRKFGLLFTIIFALGGAYYIKDNSANMAVVLFGASTLFAVTTILKASILYPLNRLWMRFGWLLGLIVRPIVLGVIFFGMFTPIAFLMRLTGRDELRLQPKNRPSYWKERHQGQPSDKTFKNQF